MSGSPSQTTSHGWWTGKKPFGNLIVLPNGSFIPTANSNSANQLGILGLLFHAASKSYTTWKVNGVIPLWGGCLFFEQGHHTPNNMEIAHLPRVDPCIKTIIAPMKPVHPWWVDPSWSITLRLWTGLQKSKSFTSWLHIMSLESKLPFKTCCTFTLQHITMSYCG